MKRTSFQSGEKNRYRAAQAVHGVIYKGQSLKQWASNHKQLDLDTKKFINAYLLGSLRWFIQNKTILNSLLK